MLWIISYVQELNKLVSDNIKYTKEKEYKNMIDQNQRSLDGEVSGYEHHVKDTDKEVCMSEYP